MELESDNSYIRRISHSTNQKAQWPREKDEQPLRNWLTRRDNTPLIALCLTLAKDIKFDASGAGTVTLHATTGLGNRSRLSNNQFLALGVNRERTLLVDSEVDMHTQTEYGSYRCNLHGLTTERLRTKYQNVRQWIAKRQYTGSKLVGEN